MASCQAGRGGADAGAIVDAVGGDRLAATGAHGAAGAGRVSRDKVNRPLFC